MQPIHFFAKLAHKLSSLICLCNILHPPNSEATLFGILQHFVHPQYIITMHFALTEARLIQIMIRCQEQALPHLPRDHFSESHF